MIESIKKIARERAFQENVISFLMDICRVDTTPNKDIGIMAANEEKVFRIITNHVKKFSLPNAEVIKKKIDPSIGDHPAFSKLHFTKTKETPGGLPASVVYRNRFNLLYCIDGIPSQRGRNTAVNAHIDVVAPYFIPERKENILVGRGVIDDKGGVATLYGALKIVDRLVQEKQVVLKNKLTAMFVTEEETGGNGSLALALDRELKKRYDSILILECAGNRVYPANRGAVWFLGKVETNIRKNYQTGKSQPSPLESMIFAILEMQKEGDAIKKESEHPLFPHKPVQTCNGILGPFGEHPSRICGYVSFEVRGVGSQEVADNVITLLHYGLKTYTDQYGDKTKYFEIDTGKPRVEKHLVTAYDPHSGILHVDVYGSTGHMGSLLHHDAAITKWAYLAREVFLYNNKLDAGWHMELDHFDSSSGLILEGGQGFLPTHTLETVEERIRMAFLRGIQQYLKRIGADEEALSGTMTFDKLHNNAYACDPGSPTAQLARKAAIQAGLMSSEDPFLGWDVSCDARLFAEEYPEMPVLTGGPGELRFAHADNEQIKLSDLFNAIVFTALYLLQETGTIP